MTTRNGAGAKIFDGGTVRASGWLHRTATVATHCSRQHSTAAGPCCGRGSSAGRRLSSRPLAATWPH